MLDYTNCATIYLSQKEGSDGNNGFAPVADLRGGGPVKTMDRVTELLRTMRASGVQQPITVKIMGDYCLEAPINPGFETVRQFFAKSHPMGNVTYESYGDTRARIIGGKRLTGFQRDTFNGVPCVSLFIPEVKNGTWHFTDLYVNGKRATSTRYPEEGTLQAVTTEFPDTGFGAGSIWFVAKKEDLENVTDVENAIVSFYHYWIDEHTPVESYDRETGKLTMALRSRFQITVNYDSPVEKDHTADLNYYLENVAATFRKPNEWYLDVQDGMLYYIPENMDTPLEELEIFAPSLSCLADIRGTAENKLYGIRFRNLDFLCTKGDYCSVKNVNYPHPALPEGERGYASDPQSVCNAGGAVRFEFAQDCALDNCSVSCTGLHGVEIGYGCDNVRVENCAIENLGAGGITLYGGSLKEAPELATGHCVIRNCRIRHCGKRYAAGCGILLRHSAHNEISDNEICYTDYSGISAGWVWGYAPSATKGNLIRGNHIHHIGMGKLSDMGGIYLLGHQNGTVVAENHIHDVCSAHYGGWGIYTDEGSSYITVEKNVVYRCKSNCFHQHYGSYNTVRDNIFAFSGCEVVALTRNEAHCGGVFEGNTYITDGKAIYRSITDGTANRYPGGFLPLRTSNNRIWDVTGAEPMLTYSEEGGPVSLTQWQQLFGKDEGSTIEKPEEILIDAENRAIIV